MSVGAFLDSRMKVIRNQDDSAIKTNIFLIPAVGLRFLLLVWVQIKKENKWNEVDAFFRDYMLQQQIFFLDKVDEDVKEIKLYVRN